MSALVFAVPFVPPAPPAPVWEGYRMSWTGADGSFWPLDGSLGVTLTSEGLVGLDFPEYDLHTSTSPAVAGSRHRGSRAKARAVEWNLIIWSDGSSAEWRARDRAFWRSFSVDEPGLWTVTDPAGRSLSLPLQLNPKDAGFPHDPSKAGFSLYQRDLIANQPFWSGAPIEKAWKAADPVDFFDAAGSPPFHVSSSASLSTATLTNPGDVSTWPVWTISAPMTSLTIEVAGGALTIPELTGSQRLVIDTDPSVATALLDGVDVFADVDPWDPRPIPAGTDVPITLTADGAGEIRVSIVPHYRRGV